MAMERTGTSVAWFKKIFLALIALVSFHTKNIASEPLIIHMSSNVQTIDGDSTLPVWVCFPNPSPRLCFGKTVSMFNTERPSLKIIGSIPHGDTKLVKSFIDYGFTTPHKASYISRTFSFFCIEPTEIAFTYFHLLDRSSWPNFHSETMQGLASRFTLDTKMFGDHRYAHLPINIKVNDCIFVDFNVRHTSIIPFYDTLENGANSAELSLRQCRASRRDCERPSGRVWRSGVTNIIPINVPGESHDMTRTTRRLVDAGERYPCDNKLIVTNIAPQDTWFVSNSGTSRATAVLHEWTNDTLASPAANAQIEGDDQAATTIVPKVRQTNYTQIIRKGYTISDTQAATEQVGGDPVAYEKRKKLIELARDMEYAFLINSAAASGASGTARQLKGVLGWISTNVTTGTGTGNEALTETMLNDNLQLVWAQGGMPSTILVGAAQKRKISAFTTNTRNVVAHDKTLTSAVDVYQSDFGEVKMVLSTIMNTTASDKLIVFGDMTLWNKAFLRPINAEELARTGSARKFMIEAEVTLESRQEKGSGKILELS